MDFGVQFGVQITRLEYNLEYKTPYGEDVERVRRGVFAFFETPIKSRVIAQIPR